MRSGLTGMERETLTMFAVVLLVIGVVNLIVLVVALRRYRWGGAMCCGGCGYDVEALETLRCPECGGLLRELGILAPTLRRGFSTWFMVAIAVVVVAAVTTAGWMVAVLEFNRSYPRSVSIVDRREVLIITPAVVPGGESGRRAVVVLKEQPRRTGLPVRMYPRIDEYRGAIVFVVESDNPTGVALGIDAGQKDSSVPLFGWREPLVPGVVGDVLRMRDVNAANVSGITAWMEGLELEWQHPTTGFISDNYDPSVSVEENIAQIVVRSIQSPPGRSGLKVRTPITGMASGELRTTRVRIERAGWVDGVGLGALGAVNLGWWGVVGVWANRRRRALRGTQGR